MHRSALDDNAVVLSSKHTNLKKIILVPTCSILDPSRQLLRKCNETVLPSAVVIKRWLQSVKGRGFWVEIRIAWQNLDAVAS